MTAATPPGGDDHAERVRRSREKWLRQLLASFAGLVQAQARPTVARMAGEKLPGELRPRFVARWEFPGVLTIFDGNDGRVLIRSKVGQPATPEDDADESPPAGPELGGDARL